MVGKTMQYYNGTVIQCYVVQVSINGQLHHVEYPPIGDPLEVFRVQDEHTFTLYRKWSPAGIWPLTTGKVVYVSRSIYRDGVLIKAEEYYLKVVDKESVNTPAGTFSCYRIDRFTTEGLESSCWYSDEVENFVKIQYEQEILLLKSWGRAL